MVQIVSGFAGVKTTSLPSVSPFFTISSNVKTFIFNDFNSFIVSGSSSLSTTIKFFNLFVFFSFTNLAIFGKLQASIK